ncbi:MAG: 5-(carboxyamino)imidazole ribonucleotide mutase [Desulfomonilia bacterium]|jgi:phosphoribosylaminoimidazole carboxylase PurE protein|uniref:N5-carboxyaminoimidazole ribonucleotide mutase n=1 Tax=anaerobic digester metagenome TaxID=1263854 RepID=A0A485LZI6_9ZZZZ|nr:5-(carboxyamino)imidazole ribonucleotide mutase [Pseudomonadota bacterium]HON37455.1 5-(carboxyamino)imidazole ribonucleotide mutase [Deltaproteobacteria bacterium]HRS55561.1 5-(carboxyamino)imidazole ribonucleotide mutase [Desulfomonilia bacterium]HPD20631.1 5-(carboxyamino)imidazole ribonucleotide mutase [Deltaproteobacteria bacterium]HPX17569.1 5-(carboxyamino)imidazole ribonucleotide mutase [Deltaproteobacteria bacterium]
MKVAVVMGSKSDLPVMEECSSLLRQFGIAYETRILSAHRTPDEVADFSRSARKEGFSLIIAGAGMSAHLAGVIAAHTTLPVIAVPIDSSSLGGIDALLSMAQMPPGIPVATMGIGKSGAKNAALLAAEILSISNPEMSEKLELYRQDMKKTVLEADESVKKL